MNIESRITDDLNKQLNDARNEVQALTEVVQTSAELIAELKAKVFNQSQEIESKDLLLAAYRERDRIEIFNRELLNLINH